MRPQVSPWRVTGYAALQVLLAPVTLLVWALVVIGTVLSVVTVGIPLVLLLFPVLRRLVDRHRRWAATVLGYDLPSHRLPVDGLPVMTRLRTWALDPMTWRELGWVLVSISVGFALSLVTVVLLLGIVTGALWWYGAPHIMWARSMLDRMFLTQGVTERLEERVAALAASRADSVDHAAAELRRIERDLHDGAQARLVSLGMTLGLAGELFEKDPEAARKLVGEARDTTGAALGDLRTVVRGIHPPVLADRGLVGAVEALALDMALPVEVSADVPDRPPAPVESALYFAVSECLTNIGRHADASEASVDLRWPPGRLVVAVRDDGRGGADPGAGTGLAGVMRRLGTFDGTMSVSSPAGGPTVVTLEVPCNSSSPRTTPSSETV